MNYLIQYGFGEINVPAEELRDTLKQVVDELMDIYGDNPRYIEINVMPAQESGTYDPQTQTA